MASDLTRSAALALLGAAGPMSRTEIARRLEVSQAAITSVTKDLLERGLLQELDQEPSRGGRPARLLGLVSAAGRAVGVKVTTDHVTLVDVGLDGIVRRSWTRPIDATATSAPALLARAISGVVREVRDRTPLLGVGVAVPGAVDDQANGEVDAPTLGWSRFQLGQHLRAALGVPVLVENDVNALAVAERLYGQGRSHKDFVIVTIGSGVGSALVMDGSVYRGSRGGAGEFGHVPVSSDGPPCACGGTGCLESFVGDAGLVRAARSVGLSRVRSTTDLLRSAEAGNARAQGVFHDAGVVLGRAVAGLVNLADPEMVVVLGEGTRAWPWWEPSFDPTLRAHLMQSRRAVSVARGEWEDTSWAQGAAALVLTTPFDSAGTTGGQGALVRALITSTSASARTAP